MRLIAVVVSWNRPELLREALSAVRAQTRPVDEIVVVDNASDVPVADDVHDFFPHAIIVRLTRNMGGAGGFAAGIARALDAGPTALWLMDDDTIPSPTALEELVAARSAAPARTRLVGSAVEWIDGRSHPMNTPRVRPFASRNAVFRARLHGCYPIRSASFVSVLIDAAAVHEFGLPIADYFLWNDDFEYTARILRRTTGYICVTSRVTHKTRVFGATETDPGERFVYEVRNKLWLLRSSNPLSIPERWAYLAVTLLRWSRTIARSSDRRPLLSGLAAGIRAGITARPRSNAEVFALLEPAEGTRSSRG